jgi:MFS family permease
MVAKVKSMRKEVVIYLMIIAFTGFGLAFSNDILSNYFKDAYNVTDFQRGLIEFPREIPGVLIMLVVAALSFLGDIKISIISQIFSVIGIMALGLLTPTFGVMLIFVCIHSTGMHLFMPLQDSIGLALVKKENMGKRLGQFKGVLTASGAIGFVITFFGFKYGIFSYTSEIKWSFIIAGMSFFAVLMLLIYLRTIVDRPIVNKRKFHFVFRKEYKYYYILAILFGVQKQIMIVYGPWVLITMLGKKADTMAILYMLGALSNIVFIPAIGKWTDRFGVKKMLYADAFSFIGIHSLYGIMTYGFSNGLFLKTGLPVLITFTLFILDRMSSRMGIIRTLYLKSILVHESDLTHTLSLGMSMDHIVSIIFAILAGIVWGVWGAHYIFFFVALLSCINLIIAIRVKVK